MAKRKNESPDGGSNKKAGTATGVLVHVDESRKGQTMFWEMESIVGKRTVKGKVQYKVHWKGCTSDEDTWEPVRNLCDSAYKDALLYDKAVAAQRLENKTKSPEKTMPVKKKVARKAVHNLTLGEKEEEKQEDATSLAFKRQKKSSKKSILKDEVKDDDETIVEESPAKKLPATDAPSEAAAVIVPVVEGKEATATTESDDLQEESVPTPRASPVDEPHPVASSLEEAVEGDVSLKDDKNEPVDAEPVVNNEAPLSHAPPGSGSDPVAAAPSEETAEGNVFLKNGDIEPEVDGEVPFPVD